MEEIKTILCDLCGYVDNADKFPDLPPDTVDSGIGYECPVCGNRNEFTNNPPPDLEIKPCTEHHTAFITYHGDNI